jgi:hypothetical protein
MGLHGELYQRNLSVTLYSDILIIRSHISKWTYQMNRKTATVVLAIGSVLRGSK